MPAVLHISNTPNPLAKKFHFDCAITDGVALSFPTKESAENNAAAYAVFDVDGVTSVFMLDQVATVNLADAELWYEAEPEISMLLEEFLEEINPTASSVDESIEIPFPEDFFGLELEIQIEHINNVLDIKVRPGLARDGGGLMLMGIDGHTVYITYEGACGSCPSSTSGTLNYIQQTLKTHCHPLIDVALS